jgi:hypothetical protein
MKLGISLVLTLSLTALFLLLAVFFATRGEWFTVLAVLAGISALLWQPVH